MQLHDISSTAQLVQWPRIISLNTFLVRHLSFRAVNMFKHLILSPIVSA